MYRPQHEHCTAPPQHYTEAPLATPPWTWLRRLATFEGPRISSGVQDESIGTASIDVIKGVRQLYFDLATWPS